METVVAVVPTRHSTEVANGKVSLKCGFGDEDAMLDSWFVMLVGWWDALSSTPWTHLQIVNFQPWVL